jgi:hypothetical protein
MNHNAISVSFASVGEFAMDADKYDKRELDGSIKAARLAYLQELKDDPKRKLVHYIILFHEEAVDRPLDIHALGFDNDDKNNIIPFFRDLVCVLLFCPPLLQKAALTFFLSSSSRLMSTQIKTRLQLNSTQGIMPISKLLLKAAASFKIWLEINRLSMVKWTDGPLICHGSLTNV